MVRTLLIFLFFIPAIYAAGPMTHLYLGEEYCKMNRIEDEGKVRDFLVGTLFPDIRYITHFPREKTHPHVSHLREVQASDSLFEAG